MHFKTWQCNALQYNIMQYDDISFEMFFHALQNHWPRFSKERDQVFIIQVLKIQVTVKLSVRDIKSDSLFVFSPTDSPCQSEFSQPNRKHAYLNVGKNQVNKTSKAKARNHSFFIFAKKMKILKFLLK